MAEQRDIKYVNREFGDFKEQLTEFAKSYFPDSYNDFNETAPGMMFIEMASYVGDVLSFYQDTQLQETFLPKISSNTLRIQWKSKWLICQVYKKFVLFQNLDCQW